MLTCIRGGRVIDPAQGRDAVGDVWIRDGRIVEPPRGRRARRRDIHDASGMIVMAGAIDIHSHIAGANVNTARLLLPEWHRGARAASEQTPLSAAGWSTRQTGRDYAAMGFTTVVEPAIAPHHALHAHLELADIPIIDKAILCVLGNDDYLLRLMRDKASAAHVSEYVAWTLRRDAGARRQGHQCRRRGGVQGERARRSRSTTSFPGTASPRATSSRPCSAP